MSPVEPPVVRSKVEPQSDYRKYREVLRHDFWYSCAYCTIGESEATGIGFEIDHYTPVSIRKDLANSYENLFWSCEPCNRKKGDYPSEAGSLGRDFYIIRPDKEHPKTHYELVEEALEPRTPTGEFNIDWLELNRQSLKELRRSRFRFWKAMEVCAYGMQELRVISVDRIQPDKRGRFIRTRRELAEDFRILNKSLEKFIRERTRSPLIDPDPRHKARLQRRRKYLREEGTIGPE